MKTKRARAKTKKAGVNAAPTTGAPRSGFEILRDWFAEGVRERHRVMLVCMDTFDFFRDEDHGIYRMYFDSLEEARAHAAANLSVTHRGVQDYLMEVFDLEGAFEAQHAEGPEKGLARFLGQAS